jgi:hypothetical protein
VLVRSRSRRSRGAIEAYTGGAEIRPTRGRFLWIATDQIPNRAGRFRMTPEGYRANGFEQRIGPLVFVKSVNGYPLLVVKDSSVSAVGKTGSARALTKTGRTRKGYAAKPFIVAFIGVPRTSRQARVDVDSIMRAVTAELPATYFKAMEG